jgi:hypothetical protein
LGDWHLFGRTSDPLYHAREAPQRRIWSTIEMDLQALLQLKEERPCHDVASI